jgi:hypothetical protein
MVAGWLEQGHWAVGLTCDKREMLLLHPLVRKLNISIAFDWDANFLGASLLSLHCICGMALMCNHRLG